MVELKLPKAYLTKLAQRGNHNYNHDVIMKSRLLGVVILKCDDHHQKHKMC